VLGPSNSGYISHELHFLNVFEGFPHPIDETLYQRCMVPLVCLDGTSLAIHQVACSVTHPPDAPEYSAHWSRSMLIGYPATIRGTEAISERLDHSHPTTPR